MRADTPATDAQPTRAASLALIAGALALDFVNTASGRGGERHQDHLRSGADVVAWAIHAGVVDAPTGERIGARLQGGDAGFQRLLPGALVLREAVHAVAAAIARRTAPPEDSLAEISAGCASALTFARLEIRPDGARWRWPSEAPVPETILGPIALSAVGLLRESDPGRLKQCPGEHCGWVFFDMTKNRSRRWCEMSVCGNRAKAKAHYRRTKFAAQPVN